MFLSPTYLLQSVPIHLIPSRPSLAHPARRLKDQLEGGEAWAWGEGVGEVRKDGGGGALSRGGKEGGSEGGRGWWCRRAG